jgi:hypothetical protein
MVTPEMTMQGNELVWSAVLAWFSSKAMEWAKNSKIVPWLTAESDTLNKWVARVVALVAAVGVHFTFDSTAGVLTITGLTLVGLRDSGLEYARQLMLQSIAYQKFIKKE